MLWLKEHKIDEGIFTFTYLYDHFGKILTKELIPNGKDMVVNEENKLGMKCHYRRVYREVLFGQDEGCLCSTD